MKYICWNELEEIATQNLEKMKNMERFKWFIKEGVTKVEWNRMTEIILVILIIITIFIIVINNNICTQ